MTTDGPAGASLYQDIARPITTVSMAIMLAITAICSGVFVSRRAVAAGIINRAVINKTPTTFIASAMTNAVISISAVRTRATFVPSTAANSGSTVILISCCQSNANRVRTTADNP